MTHRLRRSIDLLALAAFTILYLVVLPLAAFAQTVTSTSTSDSVSPVTTGLLWLNEIAAPFVAGALAWIAKHLADWIKASVKNKTIAGMLERLDYAVINAVKTTQQTIVKESQAAKMPYSDGGSTITKSEAAGIKRAAIANAKTYLGQKGIAELMSVLGLSAMPDVDRVIGDRVESAVHDLRLGEEMVAATRSSLAPGVPVTADLNPR